MAEIDRRHLTLGFVSAFPAMLFEGWGALFSSGMLFGTLDADEKRDSATLLHALAAMDGPRPTEAVLAGDVKRQGRIRTLAKLGLVRPSDRGLRLTDQGRELVVQARGLRGD